MPRPLDTPPGVLPAPGSFKRLVPRKEFSHRLGESPRSTARRQTDDPEFPQTYYVNGHAFHTDADVDNYLQIVLRRGLRDKGSYPANPKGTGRPRKVSVRA
jgi:hypothetical protein